MNRGVDKYLKLGGLKYLCAKRAANFGHAYFGVPHVDAHAFVYL